MTEGPGTKQPPMHRLQTTRMMKLPPNIKSLTLAIAGVILFPSCTATGNTKPSQLAASDMAVQAIQHGKASWYSVRTNSGTRTASGQRLSNEAATAAHKTLPMGTQVRVTNQSNGKSEVVTITDRGVPVAQIVPLNGATEVDWDARLERLERAGIIRRPKQPPAWRARVVFSQSLLAGMATRSVSVCCGQLLTRS